MNTLINIITMAHTVSPVLMLVRVKLKRAWRILKQRSEKCTLYWKATKKKGMDVRITVDED